ncbi:outer membrane beta-barrel protein [Pontibacter fetidus]|uniref:Outer membrane protein beta-barrel domain-containing protein n=1 Tax=Pontibacter fetidus TaxID=2700082 RepID=A0A6B2H4Q8_9BACT|nr:outer membrane beta-barrel protein [Pontibacter fetidus]NDK54760.1 hypothetical protein [Pontibacter fetidus]
MKALFLSLTLSLSSLAAVAQPNLDSTLEKKLYVGINGLAIGFDLKYSEEPKGANIQPYTSIYFGFKPNEKLRMQVGAWYGTDNRNFGSVYVESEDKLIYYDDISKTKGVGIPITADYVLFYPLKKLQFYGTATLTPMYSTTYAEKSKTQDGIKTITYSAEASGINTFITAGFGIAYPISKRFDTYLNYYLISRNFNKDLQPRDQYPYQGSLALGLNYNFNLKREK